VGEEFISRLEELMPAEELLFESTPAFGRYKPFLEHAISHPAKANTRLLEFLVEKFTEEGDTVLDPMAGSGSTGVVAALRGRNAVQVELEPKFYGWMEKARENVEKHPTLTPKGRIVNILGDARRLSELLSQADTVITSPPYSESMTKKRKGYTIIPELAKTREMPQDTRDDNIANLPHGEISAIITSPPYTNSAVENPNVIQLQKKGWVKGGDLAKFLPQNLGPDNISNLPFVDTVITSPPYGDGYSIREGGQVCEEYVERRKKKLIEQGREDIAENLKVFEYHARNKDNIGNLPYIDTVITSPPYAESLQGKPESQKRICETPPPKGAVRKYRRKPSGYGYSESQENIGNLPYQPDAIITSPPYERQLHDSREKRASGAWNGSELDVEKNLPMGYSENPENIGNLRKETYLSAMLKVYGEMYKVLKPGGRAIVIVKPFIRQRKPVDLPWHTWLLMRSVGFVLEKLYKLRLQSVSFWRVLYQKKYPEVPRIRHEYILVCRKP